MINVSQILSKILAKLPNEYKFLLKTYFLGIAFLTFFRILLLIVNWDYASEIPGDSRLIVLLTSMWYGFRFDTVISGYILALPFLILSVSLFIRRHFLFPYRLSLAIMLILYLPAFFIDAANIPYFKYFFANITSVVFNWVEDLGFAVSMVVQDFSMLIYVFLFMLVYGFFVYLLLKVYRKIISSDKIAYGSYLKFYLIRTGLFIFFTLVLFLAIRGRVEEKSPIRIGTAYFSEYSFANQLGLNPTFTLLVSAIESSKLRSERIQFMDDEKAIEISRDYFNVDYDFEPTPISRRIESNAKPNRKNVVLVVMESMAAVRMDYFGHTTHLTPTLDSLSNISKTFTNFYTSGIHTYSGVYSTLFSYPTIWNKHPMKPSIIPHVHSIVDELRKNNYHNYFFVAHDDQFDNMAGFLYANGFEKIFSERDYPSEWILSTLGVPDHILFEETVKNLNELEDKNPFFAALLTASNHDPKIIPDGINFKPTAEKEDEQLVQYCDWSIKYFLEKASQTNWYDNTIFIFIADHGRSIKQPYDVPISFFHSPFIIFSPGDNPREEKHGELASQIDVMPTIAGLLNLSYTNSTLGVDVLKEQRPFVYFSNDNSLGVLSNEFFLIEKRENEYSLFNHKTERLENVIEDYPEKVDSMKTYSHAMLQTAQAILENYSSTR